MRRLWLFLGIFALYLAVTAGIVGGFLLLVWGATLLDACKCVPSWAPVALFLGLPAVVLVGFIAWEASGDV